MPGRARLMLPGVAVHIIQRGNYALGSNRFESEVEAAPGRRAKRGKAGRPVAQTNQDRN